MQEEIIDLIKREEIKYVNVLFTDILGFVKSVLLPAEKFPHAIEKGVLFDASSIVGYATREESDMLAKPDLRTFQVFPWIPGKKTAGVIADIYTSEGERFSGDPRYVLQRMLAEAEKEGYRFMVGPEFEFFLFKMKDGLPTVEVSDYGSYFEFSPAEDCERVKKEIIEYFQHMQYDPEAAHHEVAPGQHEIDLHYADALTMADRVVILKIAIKSIARKYGYHASFMPKPVYGVNGTGMHVHQSLITLDGRNAFYDENSEDGLSSIARYYIGGLMKYARETCAILASWVNSYKRLVPGYEAPTLIAWGYKNRSALIRIPAGRGKATRIELRNPDPAGNPYLQFAVMLGTGLEGIRNKIEPPKPVEMDLYRLTSEDKKRLNIKELPESLGEAIECMERCTLMKKILGEHVFNHFITVKRKEWEEYRAQVTEWEIKKLLPVL